MQTFEFIYRNRQKLYRAPQNWNELTAVQLVRWAAVAFGSSPEGEKLRLAIWIMYGFELKMYERIPDHYKIQLFPGIKFLFKQCELNKWLLPTIRVGRRKFYGPAEKLTNLSAHEFFNYTEVLYRAYTKKPSEQVLNSFCAVLYRPKRKDEVKDDIRAALTDAGIALRARRFKSVHLFVKLAILLNYEGCRHFIIGRNPQVFQSGGSLKAQRTAHDLVLLLSNGPFGTYIETQNANLYKFLEHVNRTLSQNKPK